VSASIIQSDDIPRKAWSDFAVSQPDGGIFHTPEMFTVFQGTPKSAPFAYAAVDGGGSQITALLSGVRVGVWGRAFAPWSSRNILYGGLLIDEKACPSDALAGLLRTYDGLVRHGVLLTEIRNLRSTESIRPSMEKAGYGYRDYLNYLFDLTRGPDALFAGFSTSCRRNIRKAESLGIRAVEIEDQGRLGLFYGLIQKTYARARVPYADYSLFKRTFELLRPKGMAAFYLGYLGDEAVAGRAVFLFKNVVYDWYAGSDPAHFKTYANEFLVWHAIRTAAKAGFNTYDFGGAGYPDEPYGVRDFKSRFGGELVHFGRYSKVYSKFRFDAARAGYRIFRPFIG
jgi:serine/alanine adding enzyme